MICLNYLLKMSLVLCHFFYNYQIQTSLTFFCVYSFTSNKAPTLLCPGIVLYFRLAAEIGDYNR
jgi:hypothetical protein